MSWGAWPLIIDAMNKSAMDQQRPRLGRLAGVSAVIAFLAATVALADASAAAKPNSCPTDKPLVVNGYATYENSADYGADGHIWALDAATRSIRVSRLGKDDYCVEVRDVGTSTTYAGLSPEGTGTVRAGVTASFVGSISYRVYGKFAPLVPTHNFIGDFDFQCNQQGTCTGRLLQDSLFFSAVDHIDFGSFSFSANAGPCGTWTQTDSGDTGDIVCP